MSRLADARVAQANARADQAAADSLVLQAENELLRMGGGPQTAPTAPPTEDLLARLTELENLGAAGPPPEPVPPPAGPPPEPVPPPAPPAAFLVPQAPATPGPPPLDMGALGLMGLTVDDVPTALNLTRRVGRAYRGADRGTRRQMRQSFGRSITSIDIKSDDGSGDGSRSSSGGESADAPDTRGVLTALLAVVKQQAETTKATHSSQEIVLRRISALDSREHVSGLTKDRGYGGTYGRFYVSKSVLQWMSDNPFVLEQSAESQIRELERQYIGIEMSMYRDKSDMNANYFGPLYHLNVRSFIKDYTSRHLDYQTAGNEQGQEGYYYPFYDGLDIVKMGKEMESKVATRINALTGHTGLEGVRPLPWVPFFNGDDWRLNAATYTAPTTFDSNGIDMARVLLLWVMDSYKARNEVLPPAFVEIMEHMDYINKRGGVYCWLRCTLIDLYSISQVGEVDTLICQLHATEFSISDCFLSVLGGKMKIAVAIAERQHLPPQECWKLLDNVLTLIKSKFTLIYKSGSKLPANISGSERGFKLKLVEFADVLYNKEEILSTLQVVNGQQIVTENSARVKRCETFHGFYGEVQKCAASRFYSPGSAIQARYEPNTDAAHFMKNLEPSTDSHSNRDLDSALAMVQAALANYGRSPKVDGRENASTYEARSKVQLEPRMPVIPPRAQVPPRGGMPSGAPPGMNPNRFLAKRTPPKFLGSRSNKISHITGGLVEFLRDLSAKSFRIDKLTAEQLVSRLRTINEIVWSKLKEERSKLQTALNMEAELTDQNFQAWSDATEEVAASIISEVRGRMADCYGIDSDKVGSDETVMDHAHVLVSFEREQMRNQVDFGTGTPQPEN